ncbi:MAG: GNAT family N-acetyltransferase [Hyphomicrobiaceae bacterium]
MTKIVPYHDVAGDDACRGDIDEIFFEASSVQEFANEDERSTFHWRWLGRYLTDEPQHAFVALRSDGGACGYVVGSLADPAPRAEFSHLGYFVDFAHLTATYPAHLHINVARDYRNRRIGEMLVEAFVRHAADSGCAGLHVVTGEGLRNVGFYERLWFSCQGTAPWRSGRVVLLGRKI